MQLGLRLSLRARRGAFSVALASSAPFASVKHLRDRGVDRRRARARRQVFSRTPRIPPSIAFKVPRPRPSCLTPSPAAVPSTSHSRPVVVSAAPPCLPVAKLICGGMEAIRPCPRALCRRLRRPIVVSLQSGCVVHSSKCNIFQFYATSTRRMLREKLHEGMYSTKGTFAQAN